MHSARRIKVTALVIAVLLFAILFLTGEERERSSPFRVKTEAAMQAKAEAEKAELSRLTSERLKTAEIAAKKSADDKLPLPNGAAQGPILAGKGKDAKKVDAPEEGESIGKSVAGRKKMKTAPGKTDAQVVEDEKEKEKEKAAATVELAGILKKGPIIIFSKTYCPYSMKAKVIFGKYKIVPEPYIVELDEHELGPQLQDQLLRMTGRRSVPNILINGKSIGGGDDVVALHEKGDLIKTIKQFGGARMVEVNLKSTG